MSHNSQTGKEPLPGRVPAWVFALRYALPSSQGLSAVSIAAVAGLALSVAVLIIVVSVINGFERELRERLLGVAPHMTIALRRDTDYDATLEAQLLQLPSVVGAAPYLQDGALVTANERVAGAVVTGILPNSYSGVSDLHRYVRASATGTLAGAVSLADLLKPGEFGLVIGRRLADQLAVDINDRVNVVLPGGTVTPIGVRPRQRFFTVTGVLNTQSESDARSVFLHLSDAQKLYRVGNTIRGYHIRLQDLFATETASTELEGLLQPGAARVRSWARSHGALYQAVITQKLTMFVLLSFLVGVAAFNLVSGLVMVVDQRRTDVAILGSLGGAPSSLLKMFVCLGFLLGSLGTAVGVALGVAVTLSLPSVFAWASDWSGRELMSQYFISYLPVQLKLQDIASIVLVALFLCLLSTLFPAWRASRLRPAQVLAHE